jgi:hypothetical protein
MEVKSRQKQTCKPQHLVYHGTQKVFEKISEKSWFTADINQAKRYGSRLYTARLDLDNPIDMTALDMNDGFCAKILCQYIQYSKAQIEELFEEHATSNKMWGIISNAAFIDWIEAFGYDSIVILENGHPTYLPFQENQIHICNMIQV